MAQITRASRRKLRISWEKRQPDALNNYFEYTYDGIAGSYQGRRQRVVSIMGAAAELVRSAGLSLFSRYVAGHVPSGGSRMRTCLVMLAAAAILSGASFADAADLTKVDRSIAKEPTYQTTTPRYCLLVFGPEAKSRVWLVQDGDVLYVDRNGNG